MGAHVCSWSRTVLAPACAPGGSRQRRPPSVGAAGASAHSCPVGEQGRQVLPSTRSGAIGAGQNSSSERDAEPRRRIG
ncbi:hypothetical protein FM106_26505 [Brachybacterium faecium]|nr:hypothetical protein FM106_26505 [Brachybacterium faecium]